MYERDQITGFERVSDAARDVQRCTGREAVAHTLIFFWTQISPESFCEETHASQPHPRVNDTAIGRVIQL